MGLLGQTTGPLVQTMGVPEDQHNFFCASQVLVLDLVIAGQLRPLRRLIPAAHARCRGRPFCDLAVPRDDGAQRSQWTCSHAREWQSEG